LDIRYQKEEMLPACK